MSIDTYLGLNKPDEKKEITVKPVLADVVFEPRAVYEGQYRKFYTFNDSLQALRERGYERHPRPAEAFDLICRGLEGRLSPEQQAVADDVVRSYSEWLSMAMMRKGNMLHCYLDPENLVRNGNQYIAQGGKLKHAGEEVYSIGSVRERWVYIKEVNKMNPALVEKLWSRPYAILSEDIRQDGWMWFPSENILCPVGRGIFGYGVDTLYCHGTSRGVRRNA